MSHDCAVGEFKPVENQIVVPILEIRIFYFKEPWDLIRSFYDSVANESEALEVELFEFVVFKAD